ncbi:MAG: glycosyltransferase [Thermoplasmata archaeon]|nr:glycosyltransferase [Thermoplasmata archaeon]
MEIAFFTESYPPIRDGVAQEVSALARTLTRLGHGVRVYTPDRGRGAVGPGDPDDGIRVVRSGSVPVPIYGEYRWAVFPFRSLRGERIGEDVDVIHLHTPGIMGSAAFLAARHFHKPLVGTFHTNVWAMRGSFPSTPLVRMFFRAAWWYSLGTYWRCDTATAPTTEARDALVSATGKPFRHPVLVIPNGIEVDRFRPGIERPDWKARCGFPDLPMVTYLGRLTVDKGVHRFLDAVRDASGGAKFTAVVAGVGPEEASVRRRLREDRTLSERTRFIGAVAEEEKAALLSQSALFVLPSTSDTSSLALLEAMACGVTCLAPDIGGPRELVEDGVTGRLVPVLSPGALGHAIVELIDDGAKRAQFGRAAAQHVRETASIEISARRFISLYEHLLSERRG